MRCSPLILWLESDQESDCQAQPGRSIPSACVFICRLNALHVMVRWHCTVLFGEQSNAVVLLEVSRDVMEVVS